MSIPLGIAPDSWPMLPVYLRLFNFLLQRLRKQRRSQHEYARYGGFHWRITRKFLGGTPPSFVWWSRGPWLAHKAGDSLSVWLATCSCLITCYTELQLREHVFWACTPDTCTHKRYWCFMKLRTTPVVWASTLFLGREISSSNFGTECLRIEPPHSTQGLYSPKNTIGVLRFISWKLDLVELGFPPFLAPRLFIWKDMNRVGGKIWQIDDEKWGSRRGQLDVCAATCSF
jgi:hypothetical protein